MATRSEQRCAASAWLLSALLLAAPPRALGQAEPLENEAAPPEAKAHFESGREHFRAGRYREAIVELKAALELDPGSPTLMYNIAYANELLGELEDAIVYYRMYLDALPATAQKERNKIELTLRRLEGHRAQVEETPEPQPEPQPEPLPPAPAPPPVRDDSGRADTWFWLSLGSGVALLGGAAVSGVIALDREDTVSQFVVGEDGTIGERQQLIDESDRFALASDLMIGTGAALVTAAALLYFLRAPDDDPADDSGSARAALATDGREALLIVRGTF